MNPTKIYSRTDLCQSLANGATPEYFMFWGHTNLNPEKITQSCLSQWYPAPFGVEGILYPTAEHFMMAQKAKTFNDFDTFGKIIQAPTPRTAKTLGRKIRNFDEAIWNTVRLGVVYQGNFAKFSQNALFKAFLLKTGNAILVEASPADSIWGIGLSHNDPAARQPERWQGQNLLGFTLMQVRDALRDNETTRAVTQP